MTTRLRKSLGVRVLSLLLTVCLTMSSFDLAANARYISPEGWDPTIPGVGTNRYAYAENDPINHRDPSGHCLEDACVLEGAAVMGCASGGCAAILEGVIGIGVGLGLWGAAAKVHNVVANEKAAPTDEGEKTETDVEGRDQNNKPSIADQARELKGKNNGKNRVTIPSDDGKKETHYDLDGTPHKGVDTPHVQESNENVDKATGRKFMNKDRKNVRPMNQEDIDRVKDHLDKSNKEGGSDDHGKGNLE